MKILLTGITGQVGWELQQTLMPLGKVISTGRSISQRALQMDLAQPDTIRRTLREVKPTLIVNAAAYTSVDKAELDSDTAMAVNGIAPGIIAEEAKSLGAAVIHYSTDYVFDGKKSTAYTEQDLPNPQNVYGKTKLIGEQAIEAVGGSYSILRTSWVYSRHRNNFLLTILRLAQEREELRVVNDQVGSPTWSRLIAEATAQILFQATKQNLYDFLAHKSGIYHLSATGQVSWYGFAKAILEQERKFNTFKLQRLVAIASEQYSTPAKRPTYSVLNNQKLSDTFGIVLPNWQRTLQLLLTPEAIAS
ncbi:MAG: dTDP-4-dehydrorhamnose reductase [Chroococcidiopsis sp. SAG 2025]|uniref:dTDP-4-dehydrorhamnose reductase n=1 Tax=Chroococcidiopsis sp. SAG 2025 TaxID=171389 RepID=UPI0029374250|nr:dTDP-4-dehydrorhamnose reductase [Chroococcidiopsis sp. SAG 2025]MDV2995550.1 dTDP-4-dehydrorhamnose reductase [Chroococcidiopsis sp. SAG 2025]